MLADWQGVLRGLFLCCSCVVLVLFLRCSCVVLVLFLVVVLVRGKPGAQDFGAVAVCGVIYRVARHLERGTAMARSIGSSCVEYVEIGS